MYWFKLDNILKIAFPKVTSWFLEYVKICHAWKNSIIKYIFYEASLTLTLQMCKKRVGKPKLTASIKF